MCEILGFSSQHKKDIRTYLSEFYSHCDEHPNGWGLAMFDGNSVVINSEPVLADNSTWLSELLENPVVSPTVLAHIRKATVGGVNAENCHPFVRLDNSWRMWTLIHNGTVFNGLELLQYRNKQTGDTDSERILLYLIDQINEEIELRGCGLNSFERFKVVERVISRLSYRNKINLLIYDGQQMYVHVNMKNTLFVKQEEDSALFATVPLGEEGWEPLPITTLLVYRDGKLEYKGNNHHNEYIDVIGAIEQQYDYNI